MKLYDDADKAESLDGQWYVYVADKDPHAEHEGDKHEKCGCLMARVRRITSTQDEAFRMRSGAKNRTSVKYATGGKFAEVQADRNQQILLNVLRGTFALTGLRNADVGVADGGAATFWAKEMGTPVDVGTAVRIDNFLSEAAKRRVIQEQVDLRNFVLKKADSQQLEADEDDEGKGETS